MEHIEFQIYKNHLSTHIIGILCSLLIGIAFGGVAVYAWLSEYTMVRFEYEASTFIEQTNHTANPARNVIAEKSI